MNASSITLIGNVVATPEGAQVAGGQNKLTFTVACEHRFQKNGEWESKPSFIRVVAWRDLAERAKLLEKGMRVIVSGRLDQRSWKDDDGKTNSMTEVVADDIAVSVRGISAVTRRLSPSQGPAVSSAEEDSVW